MSTLESKLKQKTKSGLPKNTRMVQYRDGKRLIVLFYYFDSKTRKVVYGSAIDRPDPEDEKTEMKIVQKGDKIKLVLQYKSDEVKTKTDSKETPLVQKLQKTLVQVEKDRNKAKERKILDSLCKTAIARTVHPDALSFTITLEEWNAVHAMARTKNLVAAQLNQKIFNLENPDVEINKLESRQNARDRIAHAFKSMPLAKAKALKKRIMDNIRAEDIANKARLDKAISAQTRVDMDKYVLDKVKSRARTQAQIKVEFT